MESCGTGNEKAFKLITKKWFLALMGIIATLTCCCFGCFCCFFCCNFCCGKFKPTDNDDNNDEHNAFIHRYESTQNIFSSDTSSKRPSVILMYDKNHE